MKTKLLVVAATIDELRPLYELAGWERTSLICTENFDICITGVGMTATAFTLGQQLSPVYHQVLNVGIAGSFNPKIEPGSLVNVVNDTFSELGAQDGEAFITLDDLGFGKSRFTAKVISHPLIAQLPMVNGITVNTIHGYEPSIEEICQRIDVQVESMEGAAVFYAAEQLNIPPIQIRCISNFVERRNREQWKVGLAITNLNKWLIRYLDTFS